MNAQEMRLDYQEAVHLIRVGRFEESLEILERLNTERPDVKNVLYPMAVCYEKLGRAEAALEVCERLIAQYDHEQAKQIKARIELHTPYPEAVEVTDEESLSPTNENANPEAATEAAEKNETGQQTASRHKKPAWLVLLAALVVAALAAGLFYLFLLM